MFTRSMVELIDTGTQSDWQTLFMTCIWSYNSSEFTQVILAMNYVDAADQGFLF